MRVLSAAAVVAILALLVPLLAGIDGGGDDEATFESTGDAIESAGDATTDSVEQAEPEASTTTGLADASGDGALGTYPDLDALADTVAGGQLDSGGFNTQTQRGLGEARLCGPAPPPGTRVSTAVVAGEPVVVWLSVSPEGRSVLTVLRADGCEVIEERELAGARTRGPPWRSSLGCSPMSDARPPDPRAGRPPLRALPAPEVDTTDWPAQAADTIERAVQGVRDKTTGPGDHRRPLGGGRALPRDHRHHGGDPPRIALVRVLDVYLPESVFGETHVWAAYLILGLPVFGLGIWLISKRNSPDPDAA